MTLYKLSDEEYKLLLEMDKRNDNINITDNIVKGCYKIDPYTISDVYNAVTITAKKIAQEYEEKCNQMFMNMMEVGR